jgi:hypothetical protein
MVQISLGKRQDHISKNNQRKKGWRHGSNLKAPSKHKALRSNPSTIKRKKKNPRRQKSHKYTHTQEYPHLILKPKEK